MVVAVPRVLPQPLHEPHSVAVPGHGVGSGGVAVTAATAGLAPPLPLHKAPGPALPARR